MIKTKQISFLFSVIKIYVLVVLRQYILFSIKAILKLSQNSIKLYHIYCQDGQHCFLRECFYFSTKFQSY